MFSFPHPSARFKGLSDKPGLSWYVECLVFLAVFSVGTALQMLPVGLGTAVWMFLSPGLLADALSQSAGDLTAKLMAEMPDWLLLLQLFATVLTTGTVLLFCFLFQKRRPASLGFVRQHLLGNYLGGMLAGLLLFSAAVGICVLIGVITFSVQSFSLPLLGLYFLGFLVQGMSEEVLCRGYFLLSVTRKNPVWLAVLLNSILFGLLHVLNAGFSPIAFLNITLFGVGESLLVLRRGEIWSACGIHSLWNFAQGNLFGIPVSGTSVGCSLFSANLQAGESLVSGGSFGAEGGVAVTLVLLLFILSLLFLPNFGRNGKNLCGMD